MKHSPHAPLVIASVLVMTLALACESRTSPEPPIVVDPASPANVGPVSVEPDPIEVFLVVARSGRPAELRLRDGAKHRYPLTTRAEVSALVNERKPRSVTVRHGKSVPKSELESLVAFLRAAGVKRIDYVVAPRPPSIPASRESL